MNQEKITNKPLRQTLLECHWNQARFISRERMWIAGLYSVAWGVSLSRSSLSNSATILFLLGLGFIGLIYLMKQNYLYEYHFYKAQNYANVSSNQEFSVEIIAPPMTNTHLFSISGVLVALFCGGITISFIYMILLTKQASVLVALLVVLIFFFFIFASCIAITVNSLKKARLYAKGNIALEI